MRFLFIATLFALAGCQSLTAPLTAESLPAPLTASGGQPRFPIQNDSGAADVVVVEEAEAEAEVVAEKADDKDAVKTECKRPTLVSVNAVGNPCETTRSFMQSRGMTEEQIARVLNQAAH